jgi:hypothetical protein
MAVNSDFVTLARSLGLTEIGQQVFIPGLTDSSQQESTLRLMRDAVRFIGEESGHPITLRMVPGAQPGGTTYEVVSPRLGATDLLVHLKSLLANSDSDDSEA